VAKKKIIRKKIAKRSQNLTQDNPLRDFLLNDGNKMERPESSKVEFNHSKCCFEGTINNQLVQAQAKTNVILELPFDRQLNTFRIEQEEIIQELRRMKGTQRWLMASLRRVRFSFNSNNYSNKNND
jgi:hypothetical protein